MTPEQFCYWLQGAIELADMKEMSPKDIQVLKDHLKLVFEKLTPVYGVNPIPLPEIQSPLVGGSGGIWIGPAVNPVPYSVSDGTAGTPEQYVTVSC